MFGIDFMLFGIYKGMATRYDLVFKNGIYRIMQHDKTIKIITKYDQSDKVYEKRAVSEFDEFIKEKRSSMPDKKVVKSAYL